MKDLQKEYNIKFVRDDGLLDKYGYDKNGDPDTSANLIWYWIQENYIPKDKVRGLKMEHLISINPKRVEDLNCLINEFNNSIDELIK